VNQVTVILYEVILWFVALAALPKLFYNYFFRNKYRNSLMNRLGFNLKDFNKGSAPVIWFHAVSMGETKAITALAREIKRLIPQSSIMVSSTTETGHAEAKRSLSFADHHVYLPFDFNWIVNSTIKKFSPKLIILSESDFWYNFLRIAKSHGSLVALVNGKISERSTARFKFASFFSKRLFNLFDSLCVQNSLYAKRLVEAGAPVDKMSITGNLKFDDEYPQLSLEEIIQWKQKLGIGPDQIVLTMGSSHHPEEQLLIQTLKDMWDKNPNLKVIIVPRHPERFKTVESLLENARLTWISFTNIGLKTGNEQVILIDAMGMLRMCYQLSDVAIVGGSFTDKVGGHNILEPCWYGKPVLFGPYMHTQLELVSLIEQSNAGLQVTEHELPSALQRLLDNPGERHAFGERGLALVKELKGSTARTIQALEPLLEKIKTFTTI
jgi:3-deoxy-D-manno-octulosonic-acid transferase